MALVEWWLEEEKKKKKIMSRRCSEMKDLRNREKFGRGLCAESAIVSTI
jgi:hypothetical protein